MSRYRIHIIRPAELLPDHAARWSQIQQSTRGLCNPCFGITFTKILAECRRNTFVALLESDGLTMAFFPFEKDAFGIGRPIGGYFTDFTGIIGTLDETFDAAELLRASRIGYFDFYHMLATQSAFMPYHQRRVEAPYIKLPGWVNLFQTTRATEGSRLIEEIARKTRRLEKRFGKVRLELNSRDPRVFSTLLGWKSRQYIDTYTNDVFEIPWVLNMLQRLMASPHPDCSGMVPALFVDDRLIAGCIGIRSESVFNWWFPVYDHEMAPFSPGILLLHRLIMELESVGITQIDLGKGAALYKTRFATGASMLAEGRIVRPSVATAIRKTHDWLYRLQCVRELATKIRSARRLNGRFGKE